MKRIKTVLIWTIEAVCVVSFFVGVGCLAGIENATSRGGIWIPVALTLFGGVGGILANKLMGGNE